MNSDSKISEGIFENISIDIDSLPKLEEVAFHSISTKYKSMHLVVTLLMALGFAIGGAIVGFQSGDWRVWLAMGVVVLLVLVVRILYFELSFKWKGYALREKDIIYRSGLIWRKTIVIPFARIQHGELSEGLLERYFKLKKLKIYTAGGSSSDLSIPGLAKDEAERLRQHIMQRVIEEAELELEEDITDKPEV